MVVPADEGSQEEHVGFFVSSAKCQNVQWKSTQTSVSHIIVIIILCTFAKRGRNRELHVVYFWQVIYRYPDWQRRYGFINFYLSFSLFILRARAFPLH